MTELDAGGPPPGGAAPQDGLLQVVVRLALPLEVIMASEAYAGPIREISPSLRKMIADAVALARATVVTGGRPAAEPPDVREAARTWYRRLVHGDEMIRSLGVNTMSDFLFKELTDWLAALGAAPPTQGGAT